jgi:uncharacterized integral membrane protein
MRLLRFLGWLFAISAVTVLGIWLVQDNSAETRLVLLGFPLGSLPLGIWLALAFLLGVLAAILVTLPAVARVRLRLRRLERDLDRRRSAGE